jgi:hypothetical protein
MKQKESGMKPDTKPVKHHQAKFALFLAAIMAPFIIWAFFDPQLRHDLQKSDQEFQLQVNAEGFCKQKWTETIERSNPAIPPELFTAAARNDYHRCLGDYYARYYASHPDR